MGKRADMANSTKRKEVWEVKNFTLDLIFRSEDRNGKDEFVASTETQIPVLRMGRMGPIFTDVWCNALTL